MYQCLCGAMFDRLKERKPTMNMVCQYSGFITNKKTENLTFVNTTVFVPSKMAAVNSVCH
jgi:hypothetical protein